MTLHITPLNPTIGAVVAGVDLSCELTPAQQREIDAALLAHPVSARKALLVSDGFTTRINEVSAAESRALLDLLFAHGTRPEFCVRWQWRQGDVALWDNRVTQHYAIDDYRPQRRVMHRATILGDRPF